MKETRNEFGELMKDARIAKRITFREISKYTGKKISYLSDIEWGRQIPDSVVIGMLEDFLVIQSGKLFEASRRDIEKLETSKVESSKGSLKEFVDELIDDFKKATDTLHFERCTDEYNIEGYRDRLDKEFLSLNNEFDSKLTELEKFVNELLEYTSCNISPETDPTDDITHYREEFNRIVGK